MPLGSFFVFYLKVGIDTMEEKQQKVSLRERTLRLCNRYAIVLQFFACFILCFAIEWMARRSPSQAAAFFDNSTKIFVYNTILIFITTLPVFLFRRRTFWRALIFAVWLVLGAANGILLANRVTPLTGPDLHLLIEGVAVFGKYLSKPIEIILIGVLITLAVSFIILFFNDSYIDQVLQTGLKIAIEKSMPQNTVIFLSMKIQMDFQHDTILGKCTGFIRAENIH